VNALLQGGTGALPHGYGWALLQTLLALGAVCALAWVLLKWGASRGFGGASAGGRVKVLERVALDPRRSLYLVQVGERVLLLGAGDGAAPSLLTEMPADSVAALATPTPRGFADVLAKATRKAPGVASITDATATVRKPEEGTP